MAGCKNYSKKSVFSVRKHPETGTRRRHGSRGPPPGMLRGLVVFVVATLVSNPIRVAAITTKNVNVG